MADKSALESIEALLQKPGNFPFDGWVVEIQQETVSVKMVSTSQIKRNVRIPDHILGSSALVKGVPVRLGKLQNEPILLAVLPQFESDANYAGKGSVIPVPPHLTVTDTVDGWLVRWTAVKGATRYQVYRNDTPDETSPDEIGYVTGTSIIVPYESPYIYFAVRSISGLNESELSAWTADTTPPAVPNTFDAEDDFQGHRLLISALDISLRTQSFKCWEVQQADDGSGTNTVDLGQMGLSDFPRLISWPQGTTKYYRIRALDQADNASDWSAWQFAFATITGIGQTIQDKFDGYGGSATSALESLWWLQIGKFDALSQVSGSVHVSENTSLVKEGAKSFRFAPPASAGASISKNVVWDLTQEGRFTDDDYLVFQIYIEQLSDMQNYALLHFKSVNGSYFDYIWNYSQTGWQTAKIKRSDFGDGEQGNPPTWASINQWIVFSGAGMSTTPIFYIDDVRIIKADPDDATTYNDTGNSWNHATDTGTDLGEWHIYPGNRSGEPSKPFSYGQIKTVASPAAWYLSHKPLATTNIVSGTIQAGVYLKGADGKAGLSFFVKDVTAGSWDMYALEADSAGNTVKLVKWVAGTRTEIASAAFAFNPGQLLWLGADFREYDTDAGRIKVYASLSEGNLIQASRMVISAQDTEWVGSAGGSVGVLTYQANARFVNLVAGSPAHADVADVAYALDGPIVAGETRRVVYNRDANYFEYTDDGVSFAPVRSGEDNWGLSIDDDFEVNDLTTVYTYAGTPFVSASNSWQPSFQNIYSSNAANRVFAYVGGLPGSGTYYVRARLGARNIGNLVAGIRVDNGSDDDFVDWTLAVNTSYSGLMMPQVRHGTSGPPGTLTTFPTWITRPEFVWLSIYVNLTGGSFGVYWSIEPFAGLLSAAYVVPTTSFTPTRAGIYVTGSAGSNYIAAFDKFTVG